MEHTNQSILVKVSDLVPSPYNVRRHSHASVEELAECKPVYVTKPGWKRDISMARTLGELPEAAQDYLNTISGLVGCPIDIVSVGPDRAQTIRIR